MNDLRNKLLQLPKRDVHNHLHLGGSMTRLLQRHPNTKLNIPTSYAGIEGMVDFIKTSVNRFLLTSQDVVFFMEMAIEQCLDDNVAYLESSIDIGLERFFENSIDGLIEARVFPQKKNMRLKIDFRPEIGINKDYPVELAYMHAHKCMESELFHSVDLYGKEIDQDLSSYTNLYDTLKRNGLKTKVHIGEFSGPKTIEDGIRLLRPTEIQHGITAASSIETMQMILDHDIQLNICPQSNIMLGAVSHLNKHPIRSLYDFGITISINTDDHLLFNSSITDQLQLLIEQDQFSFDELKAVVTRNITPK